MAFASPIHIIGGGTFSYVRSHFANSAPAYGETARRLHEIFNEKGQAAELHLTKMACSGKSKLETNEDIANLTDHILADAGSKVIIFNTAVTDFDGQIGDTPSGKYAPRLQSRKKIPDMKLSPALKIVPRIKKSRPDIFLVAFKTTTKSRVDVQLRRGRRLVTESRADLVLANDTRTLRNILLDAQGKIVHDMTYATKEESRDPTLRVMVDHVLMHMRPV